MSLLYASTCFENYVLIVRSKLYYTAPGIITAVGGRPACKTSTTQNQPHQISNTQRTEKKTDVAIQ